MDCNTSEIWIIHWQVWKIATMMLVVVKTTMIPTPIVKTHCQVMRIVNLKHFMTKEKS
jgi:hypothetical protein